MTDILFDAVLPLCGQTALAAGGTSWTSGYFSLPKIITVLVLAIPWLYLAPLAYRDAVRVHAKAETWGLLILGAGILGIFFWLLLPFFVVGLLIYLVLTVMVFLSYAIYRNGRVSEEEKILTAEHIKSLLGGGPKAEKLQVSTKLKLYERGTSVVLPPTPETAGPDDIRAYNYTQDLLYDIIWHRASEAQLIPTSDHTRVRYVIDGVVTRQDPIPTERSEAIIQYLKPISGMDREESRRPQTGRLSADLGDNPIDMELATTGTTEGQQMIFRVVQEVVQTNLEGLGMPDDVLKRVRELNASSNGVILISGSKGSGITSTLYSLIREHDAFMHQIVTLEPKAAVDLENITQHEYREPDKLSSELASALRRDPDVIMVDRCEDSSVMEQLQEAATQKIVLLGLRASDSFSALAKWVRGVGHTTPAMSVLLGVINQRLLRKLCPTCREAYRPDPQMLAKINISAGQIEQFYRPASGPLTDEKGRPYTCPTCQGSGYFGRTAIFEFLDVTDSIREMVINKASISQLKAACRKNKMLYLQEQGIRKVMEGTTSIQEVVRVTQPSNKKRQKS